MIVLYFCSAPNRIELIIIVGQQRIAKLAYVINLTPFFATFSLRLCELGTPPKAPFFRRTFWEAFKCNFYVHSFHIFHCFLYSSAQKSRNVVRFSVSIQVFFVSCNPHQCAHKNIDLKGETPFAWERRS